MHYLSVCAIIRNEALYLEEWLEFHLLQGVEHFYLYDNESTDESVRLLMRYVLKGLVTLCDWPGQGQQMQTYQDLINEHKKPRGLISKWVAFIDVDEFMFRPNGKPIPALLKRYEPYGALAVRWYLYGSNQKESYEERFVTERFTKRAEKPDKHVKSIVNMEKVLSAGKNPHCFYFPAGTYAVDERMNRLPEEYALDYHPREPELIRINHYHTKSREEYIERKTSKPDPGHGRFMEDVHGTFRAHDVNDVEDGTLRHWAPVLEYNIKKRREGR